MTRSRAAYMEWARSRPRPAWDLAGSNLAACDLSDLPGARQAVDIEGESPDGYPPLVAAIAAHLEASADRVATANGCSGANFLAMAAVLDSGDGVLVETPGYDPLPAAARMLGAQVQTFDRRFEEDYRLDADRVARALTPRTKLVVVTQPHNPSGVLAAEDEMRQLARLADRTGVRVLVDEVYRDTIFSERPAPAATLSPLVVSTASLTKAYGLASLRCGWSFAAPDWTESIRRARDVVDVWGAIPADRLSVVAFANLPRLSDRARTIIETNTRRFRQFLSEHPELECSRFAATLAFPRLRGRADSSAFTDRLLARHATAVAPGRFFDSPAHFRVALGSATDILEHGLAAMAACLEEEAS